MTYGFCNIDDFSWGTKGSHDSVGGTKNKDKKLRFVMLWVLTNVGVVFFLIFLNDIFGSDKGYVLILYSCFAMTMIGIKSLVASTSMIGDFLIFRPFYIIRNKISNKL